MGGRICTQPEEFLPQLKAKKSKMTSDNHDGGPQFLDKSDFEQQISQQTTRQC